MRVITYNEFYRNYVLRKKNELLNPKFVNLGEITLPRNSLYHYLGSGESIGPSNTEALISTYPDKVFIDFVSDFEPTIDVGKMLIFEERKEIKSYRGRHYDYGWTRDIETVYNKEKVLIVKSLGLITKFWQSRPLLFSKFTNWYDKQLALIKSINQESTLGDRSQFVRIDLPNVMPSFNNLLRDYDQFVKSFKNGVPVPDNRVIKLTKGENSYWLLDVLAFLTGDYKFSTYDQLTEKAREDLHLIFNYNSKSLVLKYSTIKDWLDELNDQAAIDKFNKRNDGSNQSLRDLSRKRLNVTKRLYLSLLNLVKGGIDEEEIKGNSDGGSTDKTSGESKKDEKSKEKEADAEEDDDRNSDVRPTTLADVLANDSAVRGESTGGGSEETDSDSGEANSELTDDSQVEEEDWTDDVDDALLEEEVTTSEAFSVSRDKNPFREPVSGIKLALEERAREGNLSVAEQKFFEKRGNRYKEIKMPNGQTIEEFVKIDEKEINSLKEDSVVDADLITVTDESFYQNRANVLRKNYVGKFLQKDVVNSVLAIQNAGICLNDLKVEEVSGVEGKYDVYTMQVHPVDGDQSTHSFRLPKVDSDGMFVVDGVKSHLQNQRMERPIRKIDRDRVVLTSYYPNQLMLTRSRKVVDNLGSWLIKQVVNASKEHRNIKYSRGSNFKGSADAPRIYSMMSSVFKWVKVGDLTLDFRVDELIKEHPEFKKHNKKDDYLIGVKDGKAVTINSFGSIEVGGEFYDEFYDLLKIDTTKAPIENVVVNISGYLYPIGVVLCYYFGIDELIKITKCITRSVPMGTRLNLARDEFALTFNDEYLIFNRNQKLAGLIFGGMRKLNNISNYSRSDLNEKGVWVPLIGDPKVKPQHFLEMENLYDLFIDPITKEELRKLKYSESFHYLLIDAVKMLEIDKTAHEVEINEQRIVGYERFAGHIYRELCRSHRAYRNKGRGRKHKFELNPEAVITNIITDTSVNLVEEANPMHELKGQEELTFGGTGGRSDISVVKRARVQLESYHGIVSEANKDSGKIGFVTYMTSDPRVADYRGNIATEEKSSIVGMSSITGNLAFGITKDD